MVRNYFKKGPKLSNSIDKAIQDVKGGMTRQNASKKHGISRQIISYHIKKQDSQSEISTFDKRGKKLSLPEEVEEMLVVCFTEMIRLGQGPSLREMRSLVSEYIKENNIPNQFKDNYPGIEWANSFMKRHKLRLKKGTSIKADRKERTSDPFIIYSFYDIIKKELERLQLQDKPGHVYNLDETSFPMHSSKTSTLGIIGKQTLRVTASSARQNVTVLATICADGSSFPPCIVFKGKRLMQQWVPDLGAAQNKTIYCVSDSGWMTSKVFHEVFVKFAEMTKDKRPILLILDGHVSHTALETIKLARDEQISIVLLPPHCTDVLQPLDKVCFAPLKRYYDQALTYYEHTSREPISKAKFVEMLTSVWNVGLSEDNIRKSFSSTGIFPYDMSKFDESRFNKSKVEAYNRWLLQGKPEDLNGIPIVPPVQEEDAEMICASEPCDITPSTTSTILNTPTCSNSKVSVGFASPSGSHFKACQHSNSCCLHLHTIQELAAAIGKFAHPKKTMEQILSDRQHTPQVKKPGGRRVIGKGATVLTHKDVIHSIEEREKLQLEKEKKKKLRKKKTSAKKKKETVDSDTSSISGASHFALESSHSSLDMSFEELLNYCSDKENDESDTETITKLPTRNFAGPVNIDDDSINKYFAVVYTEPIKQHYWGKVIKVFSNDEDSSVNKVEITFLKRRNLSSIPERITWQWPQTEDKQIIDVEHIFMGPCSPDLLKNGMYRFNDAGAIEILKTL